MNLATSFFSNYGAAGPRQVELNYRLHHYHGVLYESVTIGFIMHEINETFFNIRASRMEEKIYRKYNRKYKSQIIKKNFYV